MPDPYAGATAISKDGKTVVGYAYNSYGIDAFRWARDTGIESIKPRGWHFESYAVDVCEDGSRIVGSGTSPNGHQGFLYRVLGLVLKPEPGHMPLRISPQQGQQGCQRPP